MNKCKDLYIRVIIMNKKTALRLLKDINMFFVVDDEIKEDIFLNILNNYINIED